MLYCSMMEMRQKHIESKKKIIEGGQGSFIPSGMLLSQPCEPSSESKMKQCKTCKKWKPLKKFYKGDNDDIH